MGNSVTFVHTADMHLGAAFKGLSQSSQTVGTKLREAVFESFRQVVNLAVTKQVDFVVIAGDVFDSPDVSYRLHREFSSQMELLRDAGILVYLSAGNHDYLSAWGDRLATLPENVIVFSSEEPQRVEHYRDGEVVAALYGQSYFQKAERRNLAQGFKRDANDAIAIGVLHTDSMRDENYAPCTPTDLKSAEMDYWALGHVHVPTEVSASPPALYPGSPQGLDINESSLHGCYLVRVEEGVSPQATFVSTAQIAWEHYTISIDQLVTVESLEQYIFEVAQELMEKHNASVCARIKLTGRGPLHSKIKAPGLLADIKMLIWERCFCGSTWFWIDTITDDTQPTLDQEKILQSGLFSAAFIEIADESKSKEQQDGLVEELESAAWGIAKVRSLDIDADEIAEKAKLRVLDLLVGDEVL